MRILEGSSLVEVHPTFLYESICTLIIFIILLVKSNKRKFDGELTLIYISTYSFARMIIEGLRSDSLMLGNLRISQILSVILFVCTIYIYFTKVKRKKVDEN